MSGENNILSHNTIIEENNTIIEENNSITEKNIEAILPFNDNDSVLPINDSNDRDTVLPSNDSINIHNQEIINIYDDPESTQESTSESGSYHACDDDNNPVCRQFVNQGQCRKRKRCCFYHPPEITDTVIRNATRELGYCYCGAIQKRIINNRSRRTNRDGETSPMFFVICSRTGRSMKRCM